MLNYSLTVWHEEGSETLDYESWRDYQKALTYWRGLYGEARVWAHN